MSYSNAPSTACSPTRASKWSASNSPKKESAKALKNLSLYINSNTTVKKGPSTSFYKNISLTPATYKQTVKRDINILHESRIYKNLVAKAESRQNAKRDPILQNNGEENIVFKSSIRRLASADRLSECMDDSFRRSRGVGQFNHVYSPRAENEKATGVRTFRTVQSEGDEDGFVRMRKARCTSSDAGRNPITEGDERSAIFKRWRKGVDPVDEQKRMNDKKYLLSTERGTSPKGRVHRDMTLTLGDYDYASTSKYEKIVSTQTARPVTAQEEKMRGHIKGVINYDSCQNFKTFKVTDKITSNDFNQLSPRENLSVFGRKHTLC